MRNNLEQGGMIGPPWRPEYLDVSIGAPEVQIALALFSYDKNHHEYRVSGTAGEHLSDSEKSMAMKEWIGDPLDRNSFAAKYRAYVESHPLEHVTVHDEYALSKILDALENNSREHEAKRRSS